MHWRPFSPLRPRFGCLCFVFSVLIHSHFEWILTCQTDFNQAVIFSKRIWENFQPSNTDVVVCNENSWVIAPTEQKKKKKRDTTQIKVFHKHVCSEQNSQWLGLLWC
jgi:hypothetical protein